MDISFNEFDLNIFESASVYDPSLYFRESSDDYFIYTETPKEKITKGNFISKAFEMIKKAWAWICKQFGRLINWLSKLFGIRKDPKSADQCAKAVFGEVKSKVVPSKDGKKQTTSISIPSAPESEVKMPDQIELAYKQLDLEFQNGAIHVKDVYKDWKMKGERDHRTLEQPGHDGTLSSAWPSNVLIMTSNSEFRAATFKFIRLAIELFNSKNKDDLAAKTKAAKLIYDYVEDHDWDANTGAIISLAQLREIQKELTVIQEPLTKLDHSKIYLLDENSDAISLINSGLHYIMHLQFGLNALTDAVLDTYKIDAKYTGLAKTVDELARFAKSMIDAGIPPKFVSWNCYAIAAEDIKGGPNDGSKPCWGQTRVVFFPNDARYVYKIAVSGYGYIANKSEYDICKKVENTAEYTKNPQRMPIAITYELKGGAAVSVAERVNNNISDLSILKDFSNTLKTMCINANIPVITDYSTSDGFNLGQRSNRTPVILDYGMSNRPYSNAS